MFKEKIYAEERFKVRSLAILVSCLFLSSCGFQPLLTGDPEKMQTFSIQVEGGGYSAYKFRRELEKVLISTPKISNEKIDVVVSVVSTSSNAVFGDDATVTRAQEKAAANFTIRKSGKQLYQGSIDTQASYPLSSNEEFANRMSQSAAVERTLIALAEDLGREIQRVIRAQ